MPRFFRRMAALVFAMLCLTASMVCRAAAPIISASSYVLMDADSGRVLLARDETAEKPIASTTKIMTALVALRHSRPTDEVTVRREHLKEGSSMYLIEGETLTVEALLYGLMLPSGNDAAECIADACGGTEQFIVWMNETAAELGMNHSAFVNPSGLDAPGHYSCALDMARLMAHAMTDPAFAQLASAKSVTAGNRVMANHNKLLGTVEGCIGGKTGYTGSAGRTLVTCAERDGLRLVAVTLHDGSDWADHTALYEYGFENYHSRMPVRRGEVLAECAVRGGESVSVPLAAERAFSCAVAEGEKLTLHIEAPETAEAPVTAGQRLGEVTILLGDTELGRVGLTARHGVSAAPLSEKTTFLDKLRALFGA